MVVVSTYRVRAELTVVFLYLRPDSSLEPEHGGSMKLAHPRFGDSELYSHLFHRLVFVIIERNDLPFLVGERVDVFGEKYSDLFFFQHVQRPPLGGIGDEGTEFGFLLLAFLGFWPVEREKGEAAGLREEVAEFLDGYTHLFGDFVVGGCSSEFLFEFPDDLGEFLFLAPHRARSPVLLPEVIEHSPAYAELGVGVELDAPVGDELVYRVDKAEDAGVDDIFDLDACRQAQTQPFGYEFDQWGILPDQFVPTVQ